MDKHSLQAYVSEELYEWIRLQAYLKKQSVSATAVQMLENLMEQQNESK